jgi:hypothetical protein
MAMMIRVYAAKRNWLGFRDLEQLLDSGGDCTGEVHSLIF